MREVYRDIVYGLTLLIASFTAYLAWRGPQAADPPAVQAAANHPIGGLILVATLFLFAGALNFAPLLLRLLSRKKIDTATEDEGTVDNAENDDTDYRELFLAENDARNKYQEKYAEAANKVLELQSALSQPQTLRAKVISLCDDLRSFLSKYGPIPNVARNANEEDEEYVSRKWDVEDTWKSKMAADFRLNFVGRIEKLRDEIQVVSGLRSYRIDTLMASAQTRVCDPNTVEEIHTELWTLAGGMMTS